MEFTEDILAKPLDVAAADVEQGQKVDKSDGRMMDAATKEYNQL